jgi:hypothetical protein
MGTVAGAWNRATPSAAAQTKRYVFAALRKNMELASASTLEARRRKMSYDV